MLFILKTEVVQIFLVKTWTLPNPEAKLLNPQRHYSNTSS